ncbi:MAG: amino acid adenylation domain-containing protein, partial [Pseudomonadota bacterium]
MRARDAGKDVAFWRDALADHDGVSPLASVPRPGGESGTARAGLLSHADTLSDADTARLRRFAQDAGLTLNTLVQGAFGLVLGRRGASRDVVFGATVAGRPPSLAGAAAMVGMMMNTVPVRVPLPAHLPVRDWLRLLQAKQGQATAFEHVALGQLQREINQNRALFDCVLAVESYPTATRMLETDGRLRLDSLRFDDWTHFPLTVLVGDGDALQVTARYRTDKLEAQWVRSLLDHLMRVLREIPEHAAARLGALGRIDSAGLASIQKWNATTKPREGAQDLATMFETQVQRTPSATALIGLEQQLDYADLNQRANALASRLLAAGIGPEDRVAVYLPRGIDMVVAVLATVKAGAAYVPLDPGYPRARLQYILQDAQPRACIVDTAADLAALDAGGSLLVDLATDAAATDRVDNPPRALHPDAAVYVIYTSGSTGQPKGAVNTHAALVNRLAWMQESYRLDDTDRVLHKTPLGFDVSAWELFWPLISGAALVLAAPDEHRDADAIAQRVRDQQITTMHFVPSMLQAFTEANGAADCASLRRIICSGEALLPAQVARCAALFPGAEVHNLYGPTEAAIDVTAWACDAARDSTTVPIGTPIANTQVYVLDDDQLPVAPGTTGELYLGGVGLARGYHGRPA